MKKSHKARWALLITMLLAGASAIGIKLFRK